MSLRELFSDREPDLPRLYKYPDGHWLRANMVATADGAASLNGLTRGISSDTDRRVFALRGLRGQVVLVDPETKLVLVQTALAQGTDLAAHELFALFSALSSQLP